jgi:L-iditol 2-dehydrogenase
MRAARLHGVGDLRLGDEDRPTAAADESLVRVGAVGLCGSDLHWFNEGGVGDAVITRPIVPGHEIAGIALSGPHEGRLVAVDPAIPCGHCPMCFEGHRNLCPTVKFSGHGSLDGGLREVMAWPTHLLHPLPETMSAADGAMLEPLGVALHAWDLSHTTLGSTVAVVGCGPIGLLLVQVAITGGAGRVIAVDPLPHRREAAVRYGAEVALTPEQAADPAVWSELTGLGCGVSFEVAGNDDAIELALLAARPGARVVLAGIPDDDHSGFPAGLTRRKGLTLVLVRRMKEMYERTIALVEAGDVDVRSVVSDTFPLSRSTEAFTSATARAGLKVVIAPDQT